MSRHERMKIWVISTQNAIHAIHSVLSMLCYTMLFLPLHNETYIPGFNFISYLTNHQIQMLKRRKCGRFPHFEFIRYYVLCLRDTCFDFQYLYFLIIWQVLTTRISHPSSSTKKSKKRYNLMIESLLSNNTSARGKNLWPPTQKWNNDLYLQENQGL